MLYGIIIKYFFPGFNFPLKAFSRIVGFINFKAKREREKIKQKNLMEDGKEYL